MAKGGTDQVGVEGKRIACGCSSNRIEFLVVLIPFTRCLFEFYMWAFTEKDKGVRGKEKGKKGDDAKQSKPNEKEG